MAVLTEEGEAESGPGASTLASGAATGSSVAPPPTENAAEGLPLGQPAVSQVQALAATGLPKPPSSPADRRRIAEAVRNGRWCQMPGLADLLDKFSQDNTEYGMDGSVAEGVTVSRIPAGFPESSNQEAPDVPWAYWRDGWTAGADRGGAIVLHPPNCRKDLFVLWVHGGAFQFGGPESLVPVASMIAAETGLAIVCPDHFLSGEGRPFQAATILRQLVASFLWLMRKSPVTQRGHDSEVLKEGVRVILLGDSTGGTQAFSLFLALLRHHPEIAPAVKGIAMLSPCLDLTCRSHTYVSCAWCPSNHTGDAWFRDSVDFNRNHFHHIGLVYAGSEEAMQDCIISPYWLARGYDEALLAALEGAAVPLWICVGTPETLVGETLDFAERLGRRLHLEVWLHEGMFHGWMFFAPGLGLPSCTVGRRRLVDFLLRLAGPGDTPKVRRGIHYHTEEW